jgi:hypothetical protein
VNCKTYCKTHTLFSPVERAFFNEINGWGARIRTWEWRNQNPSLIVGIVECFCKTTAIGMRRNQCFSIAV